ncbi:MAG: 2-C-methyl-D-erythritol 2,4-cyclodiphosphate synthase [Candidatus Desulfaltia sp.]|nr:2-C-methyl-D-erythritol 2,4-cyclodiphosphate synthase [Candidatus Desulfaltia sp.]
MRIGIGYDIHRLVPGRQLVIGGVAIPFEKGLLGHSDADVLIHALCDALLGAAGLGDIGIYFPDTDKQFKDISSIKLLVKTCEMVSSKGFTISNIDSTVFAEAPKLLPYRKAMQKNIAKTIKIEVDRVNIKATTTEGLGIIGTGEGIAAMCIAMLKESA